MTQPSTESVLVALRSGDSKTAERLCRSFMLQESENSDLMPLLALSLWQQGNHDEALEIYARLTRLHPEDNIHWRNYAAVLRKSADLSAAEKAYESAVRLAPDDAELLEQCALVQMDLGKRVEAREMLLRAFGKAPHSIAIRIHAALACAACRDLRADGLLRTWREWLPLDDYLQAQLAEALAKQNDVDSALELFEDLNKRLPAERRLRLRLAGLYERVNRLEEAETVLESVAAETSEDDPCSREIAHQRAQLAVRRREYTAARKMLDDVGPRDSLDFTHWFALAHACDKMGDTDSAMSALGTAHAIQLAEIKVLHPPWFESDGGSPLKGKERVSQADYAKWPTLQVPVSAQSPVFVVGFPRSGTTLLEQMLDSHSHLQSMDERPFFQKLTRQLENSTGFQYPQDLGNLDQRDCDELRKGYLIHACGKIPRRWDAQLVDKNPMNMMWLPMIHRLYPSARIIFALRHPYDVILSNYMQNFMAPALGAACADLQTLANAYVEVTEHWLYHVQLFRPSVIVSRYEELVANPVRQTQRIAEFLELESAESMLDFDTRAREKTFIATPSYTQVIEPITVKSVGRWQRYRKYLEPLLPVLQSAFDHWGYSSDPTTFTEQSMNLNDGFSPPNIQLS